jgi:hypothetical protein
MHSPILAPAAILVLWTLVVLAWLAISRFSAMSKVKLDLSSAKPGGRGIDLEPVLPANANWVSHNYTHLVEQPTLFYAVVVILAVAGAGDGINAQLAWAYTAIRIVHSLWQMVVNSIPVRFALFLASTGCLLALAVNSVRATLG